MTVRNRAILWLLRDTGLQVSELCGLRLADVDRIGGTVTVRGKRGHFRTFPLSADGQRAVGAYLNQARLTPTWEPAMPEAQDRLLLTEQRGQERVAQECSEESMFTWQSRRGKSKSRKEQGRGRGHRRSS